MVFRILRPNSVSVWKNEKIMKRFPRYRGILDNAQISRFLIAKSLECKFDLNNSLENLKALLKEKSME
ncbi:unnamed protein product [marine sediment metagenome]|uniref:Uncharacterized protein n=1 Tax=marine sediment metagenome TaxID=412755 RepID=X1SZQ4_9ZZZZ